LEAAAATVPRGAAGFAGDDAAPHDHGRAGDLLRRARTVAASVVVIVLRVRVVLRLLGRSFSFQLQAGVETSVPFQFALNKAKSLNRPVGASADGQLRLAAKLEARFQTVAALPGLILL